MTAVVSVVLPCHDGEAFLRETVASVLAQTYAAKELVLVDDGSTDGTPEIIAELIADYPGEAIRTVRQANAGQAAARNRGIAMASGRYILPLDQDDLIAPEMLAACVETLDREAQVAIVYPDRVDFGASCGTFEAGPFALERLRYFNQIGYCAAYRKSMWVEIGGYRANVSGFDDWDFWVAAALKGFRGQRLARAYFRHRRRADSQMVRLAPDYATLFARIILNNAGAYAPEEVASARALLESGRRSGLFRATAFLFTRRYWPAAGVT
jgi:glycosyltransferase involved in cell wall biosynthesis